MPAEEGLGFALNPGGDAQAAETDRDMAGNVQDRKMPDPHGEFLLPGGATAFQNIPYEGIPETVDQPPPPEVVAKPTIPGPQYAPQGSSGGIPLFLTTTVEESQPALVPQQEPGQPPTGDAATPLQPLPAAADAVEPAPPSDPPFDPNPPIIDASDLGEALTFDGGLSDGNFVGDQGAGDTNAKPEVASVDFSANFMVTAPGPGAIRTTTYALVLDGEYTEGSPSGLTSGGVQIRLYESGGVITGSTSLTEGGVNAGNTAFTIEMNRSSGVLTLTQSYAIDHSQTDTYNGAYIEDLALLANSQVELLVSVTDDYGSGIVRSATASIDLGGNIQFGDDGPGNPTLTLSGTEPIALTFDGGLSGGNFVGVEGAGDTNGSPVVASVDFSGAFASGNLSDYGADGAGTGSVVTYELILDSAYTEGTPSGLTSGGVSIRLYESGGVITGSTSLTEVGVNAGNTAFTMVVNRSSGVLTLTQSKSIDHLQTDTYDGAYIEDLALLGNDLIQLRATASGTFDSEGDVSTEASASLDLGGNIKFGDDGPRIDLELSEGTVETDDRALSGGSGQGGAGSDMDTATLFSVTSSAAGADGDGTIVYTLDVSSVGVDSGVDDATTGYSIFLFKEGSDVVGRVGSDDTTANPGGAVAFRLSVDSGNGAVTLDQDRAIEHGEIDTSAPYLVDTETLTASVVTLTGTITDGDLDTASDSVNIGDKIVFTDDGPRIDLELSEGTVETDDRALSGGSGQGGAGSDMDTATLFSVTSSAAGADGDGTIVYTLDVSSVGVDSGVDDATTGYSIFLFKEGSDVVGRVGSDDTTANPGGAVAFRLSVDSGNGAVTLDQDRAIEHGEIDTSAPYLVDTETLTASVVTLTGTITDGDLDTASDSVNIGDKIVFTDDGPRIDLELSEGTVETDDRALSGGSGQGGAGSDMDTATLFSVTSSAAGADGDGTIVYTLDVSSVGVDSGVDDATTGYSIFLFKEGSDVVGRVGSDDTTANPGGAVAFRLSVDSGNGAVTLDQDRAIEHGEIDTSAPYLVDTETLTASVVTLTGTITDGDLDTASDSVNIGDKIVFTDDGPRIDLELSEGTVETDDRALSGGSGQGGAGSDMDTATLFSVTSSAAGADGDGTIVYTLDVSSVGVDSGVDDATTGYSIFLFKEGSDVVGRVGSDDTTANPGGAVAFRLSVDSGNGAVTLDQDRAIEHGEIDTSAPYLVDTETLTASVVTLTGTITDGDLDTASDSVNIGDKIVFTDDGPRIDLELSEGTVETDDRALSGGSGQGGAGSDMDTATLFSVTSSAAGADGDGTIVYTLDVSSVGVDSGVDDATTGYSIFLFKEGSDVVGRVGSDDTTANPGGAVAFRLSVDSGNGAVTLDQDRAIEHGEIDTSAPYLVDTETLTASVVTLTGTITDGDLDTASDSVNIGDKIVFTDDGPRIDLELSEGTVETDDRALSGGSGQGGAGSDMDTATLFSVTSSAAGADGDGTIVYTLDVSSVGVDSGVDDATTGYSIFLFKEGSDVVGRVGSDDTTANPGGAVAFRLSVDSGNGAVTLDQDRAIEHGEIDTSAPYLVDTETLTASVVTLTGTITDGDLDTASDSVNIGDKIVFTDDGPRIDLELSEGTVETDDRALSGGSGQGGAGSDMDTATLFSVTSSAAGADGDGTIVYTLDVSSVGVDSGVDDATTGYSIFLFKEGSDVVGRVGSDDTTANPGGAVAFRLSVDSGNGAVTLDQDRAIEHGEIDTSAPYLVDTETLTASVVTLTGTITDGDLDTASDSVNIGDKIVFTDDGPRIDLELSEGTVETDDRALSGGSGQGGAGSDMDTATLFSVTSSAAGADGDGTIVYTLDVSSVGVDSGVDDATTGYSIFLFKEGSDVVGRVGSDDTTANPGGAVAFRLSVDSGNGAVTLDQDRAIEHGEIDTSAPYLVDTETLTASVVTLTGTITDGDLDTASDSVNIGDKIVFTDDGPRIDLELSEGTVETDDRALSGGSGQGGAGSDMDTATLFSVTSSAAGADGDGTIVYTLDVSSVGVDSGVDDATTGYSIFLFKEGSDVVGRVGSDDTTANPGGAVAFRLSVDSGNGAVTLDQDRAIEHGEIDTSAPYLVDTETLTASVVTLTGTITDGDLDTASDSVNIGDKIVFTDDGPRIDLELSEGTVETDDRALSGGSGQGGAGSDMDTATLFSVTSSAAGADGDGTIVYTLDVSSVGVDSGVDDATTGYSIFLFKEGSDVVGRVGSDDTTANPGGAVAFRLSVDSGNGAVTLDQDRAIEHGEIDTSAPYLVDTETLTASVVTLTGTITDGDLDTASDSVNIGDKIVFTDDGPRIDLELSEGTVETDDRALSGGSGQGGAGSDMDTATLFSVTSSAAGADGDGTIVYTLDVSSVGVDSGVDDATTGYSIFLFKEGSDVVGRVGSDDTTANPGGAVAFRLSVDSGNGAVTLDQDRAIEHGEIDTSAPYLVDTETLTASVVTLTGTITDGDLDTASDSVNIGDKIVFTDDGPRIDLELSEGTVETDDRALSGGSGQGGAGSDMDTATLFSVTSSAAGADGDGTIVYTLDVSSVGVDSGVDDATTGYSIFLFKEGSDVVGRVGSDDTTANPGGAVAFRLSVDSGNGAVTLDQDRAIEHGEIDTSAPYLVDTETLTASVVTLTGTITDGDLDTASDSVNIGDKIVFTDDGPRIDLELSEGTVETDDRALSGGSGQGGAGSDMDTATLFSVTSSAAGADGDGTIVYTLDVSSVGVDSGVDDATTGYSIFLFKEGSDVVGRVGSDDTTANPGGAVAFRLSVDSGNGAVTLDQDRAIEHGEIDTSAPYLVDTETLTASVVTLTGTITDGDLDTASDSVNIGDKIVFTDDGPRIDLELSEGTVETDDRALSGGSGQGGAGSDMDTATLFSVTSSAAGADGDGTIVYTLDVSSVGVDSGVDDATTGYSIFLFKEGSDVVGRVGSDDTTANPGGAVAFRLSVDSGNGAVTLDQDRAIEHGEIDTSAPYLVDTETLTASVVTLTGTITDGDLDTASDSVNIGDKIVFTDDGPRIDLELSEGTVETDDRALSGGSGQGGAGSDMDTATLFSVTSSAAGADGDGTIVYTLDVSSVGVDSGVDDATTGYSIFLFKEGSDVVGRVGSDDTTANPGGAVAFRLSVDSGNGAVTLDQDRAIEHGEIDTSAPYLVDTETLTASVVTLTGTITDGDLDTASDSVNIGDKIVFTDDGPRIDLELSEGTVETDDRALSGGSGQGGAGSDMDTATLFSVTSSAAGADGDGTIVYTLDVSSVGVDSGVDDATTGYSIFLFKEGSDVVGRVGSDDTTANPGGAVAFRLSVDSGNGAVTLDQDRAIEHGEIDTSAPYLVDTETLTASVVTLTGTITDGDLDTASDSVNIGDKIVFTDDGPRIDLELSEGTVETDDRALSGGSGQGGAGSDMDTATLFSVTSSAAGADGDGTIVYTLDVSSVGVDSGVDDATTGYSIFLFKEGSDVVGRVGSDDTTANPGGAVAFRLSVDSGNGAVTLDQDRAIEHGEIDTSAPYLVDTETLTASVVTLTGTITDGDLDTASDSVNIGDKIVFTDDGPRIDLELSEGTVETDDRALSGGSGQGGAGSDMDTATLFSVTSSAAGADGDGTIVYTLDVSSVGVDSGVDDATTGYSIFLFKEGSDVVGRVGSDDTTANPGGAVAFRLSVDSGNGAVTLDQDRAIEHGEIDTSAPYLVDTETLTASVVTLTGTITDGDLDTASDSVNIGDKIVFTDDGPRIDLELSEGTVETDDRALSGGSGQGGAGSDMDTATLFSVTSSAAGADGDGTIVYTLDVSSVGVDSGVDDATTGYSIFLFKEGSDVVGRVGSDDTTANPGGAVAFRLSVDSGNGAVTLDQDRAIEHGEIDTSAPYLVDTETLTASVVTLTGTITDGDLDTASDSVNIGDKIVFTDDGPRIDLELSEGTVETDDRALSGGSGQGGAGSDMDTATLFSVTSSAAGADGDGTIVYTLDVSSVGVDSGVDDATTGYSIFLFKEGSDVVGRVGSDDTTANPGGAVAFRLSVDSGNGAVTLDQDRAIEHGEIDTSAPYLVDTETLTASVVTLTGTITDGDLDTASDSVNIGDKIVFTDDGPRIDLELSEGTVETDDRALSGGSGQGGAGSDMDTATLFSVTSSAAGADGDGTIVYTLDVSSVGVDSGVDDATTGYSIFLFKEGSDVVGRVGSDDTTANPGGAVAFRLSVDSGNGAVTLDQDRAIEHGEIDTSAPYLVDTETLTASVVTLTGTITDGDLDTASDSVNIGDKIVFTDDGPLLSPLSTVTLTAPYNSSPTPVLWDGYQFFDWSYGADLVSPLLSAASIDVSLTSGTSTAFSISNIVYGGDYDFSFDVYYDNGIASSLVSSVYLDADGPDSIQVYSLPTEKVLVDVDSLTPAAGGPQPAYEYLDINSAGLDLVVTGSGDVNNSSNGWAVGGNQNINPGEFIVFSYYSDYGLVDPATPEYVTDFEFQTSKYTGGISTATLAVEVFYSDGSVGFWIVSGVLEGATITIDDSGLVAVNPNPGDPSPTVTTGAGHTVTDYTLLYREVDIQYIGDKGGLNLTDAAFNTYEQNADGLTFAVNIAPIDSDSDTAVETLTVVLEGTDGTSDELDVSVGPVVLDLDRDSLVEYLHLEYNAAPFSLSILPLAAWVSPEDGLLVYDYNADGLIAEAKEFVFTMWGDDPDVLTDMQALAAYFDSNGDGLLDASDDAWESFGVWQDLNIDGIQQEGEFYGLDHWGIESIALEYDADSAPYSAADGDVQVYGQMTVTYDDGSTGLAEDVAFAVASVDQPEASLEPIVVDSSALSSVQDLVISYLESMHTIGDLDGNGDLSQAELVSGLDLAVSDYLDANALSADAYGEIEQEVFNVLAEQINDLDPDSPVDIQIDDQGNADGADLIAALDQTFDDLMLPDSPEALDLVPVGSEYG